MVAEPSDPTASTRRGRLVVLSGASGSGKSTLVARLLERPGMRLKVSISATTRDPRDGEVNAVHYFFVERADFEFGIESGFYLEWAEVHGHFYGTPLDPILIAIEQGFCIILVIDVQGAMQVREKVPDALLVFVHAPDASTLEARLRARATDDEATIQKRLTNAKREVEFAERYDHQIVNDDLDRAVDELAAILTENHCGG